MQNRVKKFSKGEVCSRDHIIFIRNISKCTRQSTSKLNNTLSFSFLEHNSLLMKLEGKFHLKIIFLMFKIKYSPYISTHSSKAALLGSFTI